MDDLLREEQPTTGEAMESEEADVHAPQGGEEQPTTGEAMESEEADVHAPQGEGRDRRPRERERGEPPTSAPAAPASDSVGVGGGGFGTKTLFMRDLPAGLQLPDLEKALVPLEVPAATPFLPSPFSCPFSRRLGCAHSNTQLLLVRVPRRRRASEAAASAATARGRAWPSPSSARRGWQRLRWSSSRATSSTPARRSEG
jgi:hypothetical protein